MRYPNVTSGAHHVFYSPESTNVGQSIFKHNLYACEACKVLQYDVQGMVTCQDQNIRHIGAVQSQILRGCIADKDNALALSTVTSSALGSPVVAEDSCAQS